jgi:hypothetical protein
VAEVGKLVVRQIARVRGFHENQATQEIASCIDNYETISNSLDGEIGLYNVNREVNRGRMQINPNLAAMGAQTLPLNTQIVNFQQYVPVIKTAALRFENAFSMFQAERVAIEAEFFAKYAEVYSGKPDPDTFDVPASPEIDDELMFMIVTHDHLDEVFTQLTGMTPGWRNIVQEIIEAEAQAEGGK